MIWPPDFEAEYQRRIGNLRRLRAKPDLLTGVHAFYSNHPVEFIRDWCTTYDPRNGDNGLPAEMPFIPFAKQEELVRFLMACISAKAGGLIEKSRDMGATWLACAFSIWLWRYRAGASVGWGSRKEDLVHRIGDPDSIFEKMRIIIDRLPREFWPKGFDPDKCIAHMRIFNPENGASITGEAGDNIGRGGRKLIYFKDESAHYERPERIEASLGDNTNTQIDISSVNGTGNVFWRKRMAGEVWSGGPMDPSRTQVFVMDWSDHPGKTQEWYDQRKQKAQDEGLSHLFAQEVDRDYSGSVQGTLIPAEWVRSAIGAQRKIAIDSSGLVLAALDVADEGMDKNAEAHRKGPLLFHVDDWPRGDTGETARRAVTSAQEAGAVSLYYDSIGVGAGVKAETNRLRQIGHLGSLNVYPWSASATVLHPKQNIIRGDRQSPTNADFYQNLNAQAGWMLRRRFEETHKAVNGKPFDPDLMIVIAEDLPKLHQLEVELSQPTYSNNPKTGKIVINKMPPGTKSPNLFDAVKMAFWPSNVAAVDISKLTTL